MPRAAGKPHSNAILLFIFAILILLALTVKWDFGDLIYLVVVFVISTYVSSLFDERGYIYMLTHPGQEIRLEGQQLRVKKLKTSELTSYDLEEFQAYRLKTIFTDWEKKFLYDVIGDVHLVPEDKHKFAIKILKVRDYKGLGKALQKLGLEERF